VNAPEHGLIYEGDCRVIMQQWPDASFDCCITDPPYNMSKKKGLGWAFSSHVTMQESWDQFAEDAYLKFTAEWLREVCRVVKPNGNVLVFGSFHNIYFIGFVLQEVLKRQLLQQVTWFKPNAQPNITGRLLTESTEFIIWACNNSPADAKNWTFNYDASKEMNQGKQLRNMWSIPVTSPSEKQFGSHPTQKPLALVERIVRLWTKAGDCVLDCFLGTGTTAVACEQTDRKWVGIEKDPKYREIATKRLHMVQKRLLFS
jgi:DNA modification methylase